MIMLGQRSMPLLWSSMVKGFAHDMMSKLSGHVRSMSPFSQRSTSLIDDVRLRALAFLNADSDDHDLLFVANATAAIKLVAELFRDFWSSGFQYGYHIDSHTSLEGLRKLATAVYCCLVDGDVTDWITENNITPSSSPTLFAFPAQSDITGRRLPLHWCDAIRGVGGQARRNVFSLLDAECFVFTAPLHVSKVGPDFVALNFSKIFGFPGLGALIVRKDAMHALDGRKASGSGSVDMVISMVISSGDKWHAKKKTSIHERFEDAALPLHNIIALEAALGTYERLYGSMANTSAHTSWLTRDAYDRLSTLRHFNGTKLCQIYRSEYGNARFQGPVTAFRLRNSRGNWIPNEDVEEVAATRDIQLHADSACNFRGAASSPRWVRTGFRRFYAAGLGCGDDPDVFEGRPTGVLRISLGAMTSLNDVKALVLFLQDTYVEKVPDINPLTPPPPSVKPFAAQCFVETLTVSPILGCGGYSIPMGERWAIDGNGLAWNHTWCLIHDTTNEILEDHTYSRMLEICPTVSSVIAFFTFRVLRGLGPINLSLRFRFLLHSPTN